MARPWNEAKRVADFWAQVRKQEGDGCWEWIGRKDMKGYGRTSILEYRGKFTRAHRVAWRHANGPIPDGLHALHRCDNPACVRVDHLFLGTNADNMRDKCVKGRQHRGVGTGNAVLNDEKVMAILTAFASGEISAKVLAAEYGVTSSTIAAIIHGQTWAHVTGPRLSPEEAAAISRKHQHDAWLKARPAGGWVMRCSNCGDIGHRRPACPTNKAA